MGKKINPTHLVIGLGEVGKPLFDVLKEEYDTEGLDNNIANYSTSYRSKFDVVHICIPWDDGFIDEVSTYEKKYVPDIVVVHSTVPIGTTRKLGNKAVHSPVLGRHSNMVEGIKHFTKPVGGKKGRKAIEYCQKANIDFNLYEEPEQTEVLKLTSLAKYGVYLAFQQYQTDVLRKHGLDYYDILCWDKNYNSGVEEELKRPLFPEPPGDQIGGHCVIPGTKKLYKSHPSKLLEEVILKYA